MTRHVFLVGAARSGTKVLRDVLAAAAGIGAVPYDVNFVWKHGHAAVPHDVLDPASATPRQRRFVTGYLDRYAQGGAVLEKTVGNSLRVGYVQALFPDAAYVHLVRDGVAVIESTERQWRAPADRRYLAEKVRHFPLRLLPTYGARFARAQVRRGGGDEAASVRSWGVRYPGIDRDVREQSLLTVCARQWHESDCRAAADLARVPAPVVQVRFEDLVAAPEREVARVLDELALPAPRDRVATAARTVRADPASPDARGLDRDALALIQREAGDALAALGYPAATDPTRRSRP